MIAEIRQGETVNIIGQLYDDEGNIITNLDGYEFKILFSSKYSNEYILLEKSQVEIDISGRIIFNLTSEQTTKLNGITIIEIEIIFNNFTSIRQSEIFKVLSTKISKI